MSPNPRILDGLQAVGDALCLGRTGWPMWRAETVSQGTPQAMTSDTQAATRRQREVVC